MDQLFGTDGIRGHAGEFPLDSATVRTVGGALARLFADKLERPPLFVVGRDTRESGDWIERAIHRGAVEAGARCESAEVITTPGVAFITKHFDFDAGIVISASHNPFHDNGIKVFLPSGQKMDEMSERIVEADVFETPTVDLESDFEPEGHRSSEFRDAYLAHLRHEAGELDLSGRRLVIDCANGAASTFAEELFLGLGASVTAIHCEPDGRNINEQCGSTHIDGLRKKVVEESADLGIAFDGDADRALFVDADGKVVDGDATLWIIANELKRAGKLKNATVVATVMSNLGLEIAFRSQGIKLLRAAVGDKFVLEELLKTKSEIGGEQSGHIIFPERSLVGDGMMTALLLLRALGTRSLSEACAGFERLPQTLKNVRVREKKPFKEVPEILDLSRQIEKELDGNGRLLLRYSGTENLARVMIEGPEQGAIEEQASRLIRAIVVALGQ